jgi:RHS repeat-associated protein
LRLRWLVSDHLGTPRVIFDKTGELGGITRHDYLHFGEELLVGRGPEQGYAGGDGVRQRFTSKKRDIETGLHYFLARYYSSVQGRFTSPDEFTGGTHEIFESVLPPNPVLYAEPAEPQSFNKYSYCLGNPLRYVDPDGHQTKQADGLIIATRKTILTAADIVTGVGKEGANVWIGMKNITHVFTGWGEYRETFKPTNKVQEASMNVTGDVAIFGGLLTGRAQGWWDCYCGWRGHHGRSIRGGECSGRYLTRQNRSSDGRKFKQRDWKKQRSISDPQCRSPNNPTRHQTRYWDCAQISGATQRLRDTRE